MTWSSREVVYFVAVAGCGSFTDAAIELGVSQAAVSRAIAATENRLGERLLRRTPHGCEPTALGLQLLPQARRILSELDVLDDIARTRRRRLRLGYAWAAVGRHTTPLLRSWPAEHPTIELQLVRHNSPTAGLAEGFCDVAVVRTPVNTSRFDTVVVGLERRLAAFATDDALWRRRRTLTMAEVGRRTLVVDPRVGTTTPALWTHDGTDSVPDLIETTDVDEWLDTIAAGRGVGSTAEATALHHPRSGVTYRPITDGPSIPVHLAWWRHEPPAGLRELVATLTSYYSTEPPTPSRPYVDPVVSTS